MHLIATKIGTNTAVNNANGVINATNNPNMDANAINDMANQVNTTKSSVKWCTKLQLKLKQMRRTQLTTHMT